MQDKLPFLHTLKKLEWISPFFVKKMLVCVIHLIKALLTETLHRHTSEMVHKCIASYQHGLALQT
ncbi:hypothetical protein D3C77_619660 [compost metagenome]